jgi:hypothetical protein
MRSSTRVAAGEVAVHDDHRGALATSVREEARCGVAVLARRREARAQRLVGVERVDTRRPAQIEDVDEPRARAACADERVARVDRRGAPKKRSTSSKGSAAS